jgi:hypothetical protein
MLVHTISYQSQRANRRGDVGRVSSHRRKTERRGGQERSRGRVGKRARLVQVVQQRAVRLLKREFVG